MVELTLLFVTPLVGALLTGLVGKTKERARAVAMTFGLLTLALAAWIAWSFPGTGAGAGGTCGKFALCEAVDWVPSFGITYLVGLDGLSMPLVVLTAILFPVAILYAWDTDKRPRAFYSLLLLQEVGIMGVFISLDFFLFYVFWEVVLIPMYVMINIWGTGDNEYSAIKFFVYTHIASVIMLIGFFVLIFHAADVLGHFTLSMVAIQRVAPNFALGTQTIAFFLLLFGFGVKLPMVPFHTWLPDAHVDAPTAGSVILAGLLLKLGGYGLVRIALPMTPDAFLEFTWVVAGLGILAMIYAAIVCLNQVDLKRMIAYSSISHMGFVLLGLAALTPIAVTGAIYQMFNHGIISAALFMMAGVMKHHAGTRDIPELSGLAGRMPMAAFVLIASFFANLGLPGLNSFISEFFVFVGAWEYLGFWILVPLVAIVITAAYHLYTLQRTMMGNFNAELGEVSDLDGNEVVALGVLVAFMILLGLYPTVVVQYITPASDQFLQLVGVI